MSGFMPTILRGDARCLPSADGSVDLIATSPPYWSLRSYSDGGEHYDGQLGSEPTWQEYVDNLLACTREWMRVLKPSGSLFVNLGDKYSTGNSGQSGMEKLGAQYSGGGHSDAKAKQSSGRVAGLPPKCLLDLPWRYGIRCVDDLGLIKRAEIVWAKANPMPESVVDRVRRSHEVILHFTKQPRYYSATDEIREPCSDTSAHAASRRSRTDARLDLANAGRTSAAHPLGKLPGSVWEIATQPLSVPAELGIDHFAAWPMEIPRRLILGWSPREVCTVCGEGRRPVATPTGRVVSSANVRELGGTAAHQYGAQAGRGDGGTERIRTTSGHNLPKRERTITGYACACPDTSAPSTPGVVLDPFGGTGTTALVATMLGRRGISVDLSADYGRLAEWRASDPKERARAAGLDPDAVAKVHHQLPGQESLLDLLGDAS